MIIKISSLLYSDHWHYIWPCYAFTAGVFAVIFMLAIKSHRKILQRLRQKA